MAGTSTTIGTGLVGAILAVVGMSTVTTEAAHADGPTGIGTLTGTVDQTVHGTVDQTVHGTVDQVVHGTVAGTVEAAAGTATGTVRHVTGAVVPHGSTRPGAVAQPLTSAHPVSKPASAAPATAHVPAPQHSATGGAVHTQHAAQAGHRSRAVPAHRRQAHRHQAHRRPAAAPARLGVPAAIEAPRSAALLTLARSRPVAATRPRAERAEKAEEACHTASLAAANLRLCAQADIVLPNLGGPRTVLLSTGIALLTAGLVTVVRSRRRPALAHR